MVGVVGLIALLTVLFLSLIITRFAAVALELTGLSSDAAKFQARSAFTGTGFTTTEAEKVIDHPVRRKIIMLLMVTRSAGVVTIVISLILSFGNADDGDARLMRLLWLAGGVAGLWLLSASSAVERMMSGVMKNLLCRWTELETVDTLGLLHLEDDYTVKKLQVKEDDWLEGKTVEHSGISDEGVLILGIYREQGDYVGAPKPSTDLHAGDTLVLYGRDERIKELSDRRQDSSGDQAHAEAVDDQRKEVEKQDQKEARREKTEEHTS
jgi:hypothetical protein